MLSALSMFLLLSCLWQSARAYYLLKDYSGESFFNEWDFYGNWDNLTLGDVWYLNRAQAHSSRLAFVNDAGNAILKVDDETHVPNGYKRNSIRITSQASYSLGSLWVIDLLHIPFGCSVWPAFWTMGPTWPDDGEIDIIEAINLFTFNQMALHTTEGCTHTTPSNQISRSTQDDCSQPSGCMVYEVQENSYGQAFADNGGGVWATQFDVSGIYMWYWPRSEVPSSIKQSSSESPLWVEDFGPPSAAYPSSTCNITEFFRPQNLVFDITLCGVWAGIDDNFVPQCGGETGKCYNDAVTGSGSRFSDAYFEVQFLRAYTTGGVVPSPTASLTPQMQRLRDNNGNGDTPTPLPRTTTSLPSIGTYVIPAPTLSNGDSETWNQQHTFKRLGLATELAVTLILLW